MKPDIEMAIRVAVSMIIEYQDYNGSGSIGLYYTAEWYTKSTDLNKKNRIYGYTNR